MATSSRLVSASCGPLRTLRLRTSPNARPDYGGDKLDAARADAVLGR